MTTTFFDNQILRFQNFIVVTFSTENKKQRFGAIFLSAPKAPPPPPPQKLKLLFLYCRLAVSGIFLENTRDFPLSKLRP